MLFDQCIKVQVTEIFNTSPTNLDVSLIVYSAATMQPTHNSMKARVFQIIHFTNYLFHLNFLEKICKSPCSELYRKQAVKWWNPVKKKQCTRLRPVNPTLAYILPCGMLASYNVQHCSLPLWFKSQNPTSWLRKMNSYTPALHKIKTHHGNHPLRYMCNGRKWRCEDTCVTPCQFQVKGQYPKKHDFARTLK